MPVTPGATPTEVNLNGTTPAAQAGYRLGLFQSGTAYPDPNNPSVLVRDVSVEVAIAGGVNAQSGTTYTLQVSDAGELVVLSATATLTLPGGLPNFFCCTVLFTGASGGTIAAGSGRVNGVTSITVAQNQGGELFFDGTNWWFVQSSNTTGGGGGSSLIGMITPSTLTPPVLGTLTWGNQDTATAAANSGGALFVSRASGVNVNDVNHLYKAAPAAPWSLIIGFIPMVGVGGYCLAGIALRESATGKITAMFMQDTTASGGTTFVIGTYQNYAIYHLTYINPNAYPVGIVWMKVRDDNAGNYIWSLSPDGQSWLDVLTKSKTDYFTTAADQVGLAINVNPPGGALFIHWAGI